MIDPPFRSPRAKVGGLFHFGRLIDKIRCHLKGALPEDYRRNFGLSPGLDGHLCGFLGVEFDDLVRKVGEGLSDEELLEWCFDKGLRPNAVQKRVWNGFAEKFGWRDRASAYLDMIRVEEKLAHRHDLLTAFDLIDAGEGRDQGGGHHP